MAHTERRTLYNLSMSTLTRFLITAAVLLTVLLPAAAVQAADPPPGFTLLINQPGVDLYTKEYSAGTPDYVQVINLARGASLSLLNGEISEPGTGSGYYLGDNPTFTRQILSDAWAGFTASSERPFCIVNGAIFYDSSDPTNLALPYKVNGEVLSGGRGIEAEASQLFMLEMFAGWARIVPFTAKAFTDSNAPNILVGLGEGAGSAIDSATGRTMIGLDGPDGNGQPEIVLIFNSKTATQGAAAGILRAFGADQVLALGYGDSAQLLCQEQPYVFARRTLPQTIGVSYVDVPEYAGGVVNLSEWSVIMENESTPIQITLRNDGTETWLPGEVYLLNTRNDWGAGDKLGLSSAVAPGETVTFEWTTTPFAKVGVFTSQWDLARGTRTFSTTLVTLKVVVLPEEMADKKEELETQIRAWAKEQVDDIEQRVLEMIQEQVARGFDRICPAGAMLPGVVVFAALWHRPRKNKPAA